MCSWAEAILPNTTDEGALFVQAFSIPKDQVTVIPNGVEERFAHASAALFEREYGIKNFILSVGQIGPDRKNMFKLIEALERIDHPAAIIGRVDDTPSGRACLERARNNSRLLIVDAIPHDSMLLASAYAACDVFALPSQFETPGIAALEAGLAGAKIVITPLGGTREYFGNDAVYVEPNSVDSIAAGIEAALKQPKASILRTRIEKEFLWQTVGVKTKAVYEKVLGTA
jgi:glycosyltransferase involved in cell wall biosynthesis